VCFWLLAGRTVLAVELNIRRCPEITLRPDPAWLASLRAEDAFENIRRQRAMWAAGGAFSDTGVPSSRSGVESSDVSSGEVASVGAAMAGSGEVSGAGGGEVSGAGGGDRSAATYSPRATVEVLLGLAGWACGGWDRE